MNVTIPQSTINMPPSHSPIKELDDKFIDLIGKFVSDIKNSKLRGSTNVALAMVTLLETIIYESPHTTVYELCRAVSAAGRRVLQAAPRALAAGNVTRRVLRAIRDEHRAASQSGEAGGESLQRLVLAASARRATLGSARHDLREHLRDHLAELRAELETAEALVGGAAAAHVQAGELLLTFGAGALPERFLRAAAARRYRLVVVESRDVHESHAMAARLSAAGVSVTVVSSAAVCAVMPRVNKVVLGVCAALGGGAALAAAGSHAVTSAAKYYSVPVLALAPLHVLCPAHAAPTGAAPRAALPYARHETGAAHVHAPLYDYTPPDHITLFITNLGGSSPSYMYRLLSELYDPSDHTL